jgi:anion-transporting  ArsA/GET3 family ATPase
MAGKRICICTGSGGVGKTTIAAAIALGLAVRGQRVAVVTIDPARRLADALGLKQLGNEPQMVEPGHFAGHGIELRGELWAMMLDAKRTFDDLIELLAPDASTREEILANRIYQELSSAAPARRSSPRWPSSTSSTPPLASTRSFSTRRPRATRWTSSTPPTA